MTRTLVVLRPEPGNGQTAERLRALGCDVAQVPLFAVTPVVWQSPDPAAYDALLLTSVNTLRHGGTGLDTMKSLPVVAVGAATAKAARAAGFMVTITGEHDAPAAIAMARTQGFARLLHLGGRDRAQTGQDTGPDTRRDTITVYASDPLPIADDVVRSFADRVVLIHSARAARAFAGHVDDAGLARGTIAIAAISHVVREAVGDDWGHIAVADIPNDAALVPLAAKLAIDRGAIAGDKRVMSDTLAATRTRGPRLGVVLALIALAFVAGLAAMGYGARTLGWFGAMRTTAPVAVKTANGAGYVPAQPLNANGETPPAASPMIDPALLVAREAALAGQLSALEARTAAVSTDAASAGAQATRAEAMLVAFATRRAIDRGVPLGYLEEQLRLRFAQMQPRAVTIVTEAARQPVTLEDLRQGLDTIAPGITTTNGGSWSQTISREIDNLIVLRRVSVPSPMPADRLARARRLLEGGQVEAARAEIARLPGAAQAGNWMTAARRFILTRQALDTIETAAILGQATASLPAAAVATPAPAPAPAPASVPSAGVGAGTAAPVTTPEWAR